MLPGSIRGRVTLSAVLSVVLACGLIVTLGFLVWPSIYLALVVNGVRSASIPAVRALEQVQAERREAMAYLAHPGDASALHHQQQQTDHALGVMQTVIGPVLDSAPPQVADAFRALSGQLAKLPAQRTAVDAGTATTHDIFLYYNGILDAATAVFDIQARIVPDAITTQGALTSVASFTVAEQASRAGALIASGLTSRTLGPVDHAEAAALIGAYHTTLDSIAPRLQPGAQARYRTLTASAEYQRLRDAETAIIEHGPWTAPHAAASVPVTDTDWQELTSHVSTALSELCFDEADQVTTAAGADAQHNAVLILSVAGLTIAAAIVMGIVALVTRRGIIDSVSAQVAAVRQRPAMMQDVAGRLLSDTVSDEDVATALPPLPRHGDELDVLADAQEQSEREHVAATRQLAATMNQLTIARHGTELAVHHITNRIRRLVGATVQVVDGMERDPNLEPALADKLFQVDHTATRMRFLLDQMLVAAGVPHRGLRVRDAVTVADVVGAAISRTEHYQRVDKAFPEIALAKTTITGPAARDLITLLTSLIDNATAWSQEPWRVLVTVESAARGITIAVDDRGQGMHIDDRVRANRRMAEPPTFEVVLETGQLGHVVVARLAARHHIEVMFTSSPYGGERAAVLIPRALFVCELPDPSAASAGSGQDDIDRPAPTPPIEPAWPTADPPMGRQPGLPAGRNADTGRHTDRPTCDGTAPAQPVQHTKSAPRPGLPRRQPQANLAPQLRDADDRAAEDDTTLIAAPDLDPEQVRARYTGYQTRTAIGREPQP